MTVKVAIVGTGWGTSIQVPAFRQAGLEIVALWASSEDKARQIADALDIPLATHDYRVLLSSREVDLISIVTPPHLHAEMATAALEAGKHVLCEKPTALNVAEAEHMLAVAQAHPDQLALIDHELRFVPTRQKMRSLIQNGYVGQVYHVEGAFMEEGRLDPGHPWRWNFEREKGGGVLGAVGSHVLDALTWLLERPAELVDAFEGICIHQRQDAGGQVYPVTSDDYAVLHVYFAGGISGIVQVSMVVAGEPTHRLLVAGSAGSLRFENGRLIGYRAGTFTPEELTVAEELAVSADLPDNEWTRGTIYLGLAIKRALETGDRSALGPAATFAQGVDIQRVLDAAGRWN
jgi:predicted dehydrogenase